MAQNKNPLYNEQNKNSKPSTKPSITPRLFPNKDESATLGWLRQRWEEMDRARPDQDWDQRYIQDKAPISWNEDGTANVNLPMERATRRLKKADEEANKPQVKFKPTEKDDVAKVEVTNVIWDFCWREADTDQELSRLRDMKHIFGTGWWREYIHEEIEERYDITEVNAEGLPVFEKKVIKRNWIKGKPIDLRNIWVDPVNNFDDADDIFEFETDVSRATIENLKKDKRYKNIDKALKSSSFQDALTKTTFRTEVEQKTGETVDNQNPKYTLVRYTNKRKGIMVESINFDTIIREGGNPTPDGSLGYVPLVDEAEYQSVYGLGIPAQMETFKYERNEVHNQLLDLVRQTSSNVLMVGGNAAIDSSEYIGGVGTIMSIDGDVNQVQYSTPPQSDKGLFNLDGMILASATEATGIDPRGTVGEPSRTLGQEQIKEVNKLKSILNSIKNFDYFMVRMARLRLAFIQAYMPETTGKKIVGNTRFRQVAIDNMSATDRFSVKKGKKTKDGLKFTKKEGRSAFFELTPSMIRSNLDVTIETPSTTTVIREIERQKVAEMMTTMSQIGQFNPELLKDIDFTALLETEFERIGVDSSLISKRADNSEDQKRDLRQQIMQKVPQPYESNKQPGRQSVNDVFNQLQQPVPGQGTPPQI